MQNDNLLIYAYREKIPFVHGEISSDGNEQKPKERKKEKKKP